MYKENGLKIQPGEQFTTKVNRKRFKIRKICDKRLEAVPEEVDH